MGLLERDGALERLDDLLAEAGQGRGRLVLVRGEAGIGKSALVEAFSAGRSGRLRWGMCDPVMPPRALAPIFDIAQQVGGELQAALADPDRHRIISAFLGVLRAEGGPWIVVLEDLQWADEATLELVRVVGRRAAQLRALVIGTVRDEEVGPDHPLSLALGDIPPSSIVSLCLEPLSPAAVSTLATASALDPAALHRATAGNPFFVTEVLAAGGADLPSTVRDAVWARARRLSGAALQLVRAASVLGPRCDASILCSLADATPADLDECVARGMLWREHATIDFRHELSRQAVLDALAPSERSRLHQRALLALRAQSPPIEAGTLARHAVEAGDVDAVLELAPQAGDRASALGAHRAALAHYQSSLPYAARLPSGERAALLAAHAHECFVIDDVDGAVTSQRAAVSYRHDDGDVSAVGLALSQLARYLWWNGDSDGANGASQEAVRLVESIPPEANVALAYAHMAGGQMMSGRYDAACEWGRRALSLAEQVGAEAVVVHALNTIGVSEVSIEIDDGWTKLEESLRRSIAADLEEDTARAFNNLIAVSRECKRYDLVERYREAAATFFDAHDLEASERCLVGDLVDALLDQGQWSAAESQAQAVVEHHSVHGRAQCLAVLGRLAARRGDGDAMYWLDQAFETQGLYGGEIAYPLRASRAEALWLAGNVRQAAQEIEAELDTFDERTNPWFVGEFAFWARRVGVDWECPRPPAEPYAFHLGGHPEKAANAWAALGCPYEEAQALADSDDESHVRRALSIFQRLGAGPGARRAVDRLRTMGAHRIARGPRSTTRGNAAGLSDREVQVALLLADGLRNGEIAKRLVLSTRTVDHHVSAILTKLKVRSRYDAGRKAIALGLTDTPK